MPSPAFRVAWLMLRICARKVSDTPNPAASSDARVMRKPDDKCSTDFANEAWLTDRFRCAARDEMLVLTTNAMTYFLLKALHYSRTFAGIRANEVVTRPEEDVRTSPPILLPYCCAPYRRHIKKT